jgi:cysteinyl-tRNA synthetase
MEWDSPWGRGAPGWHLECSVMSLKYLGPEPFDIHTGGIDHREIHHPNEIAQNQAFCDCAAEQPGFTGARFWMHNNFLVDRSGKMSKSDGSFTTLQSLIDAGVHPLAYRLLCLSAQYRSELEFSQDAIGAALTRLKRLVMAVEKLGADSATPARSYVERLDAALSDDLNSPMALVALDELLADKKLPPADRRATLAIFDAALGLDLTNLKRVDLRVRPARAMLAENAIEARLDQRTDARNARDFARSDAIRDELAAAGIDVMDGDPLRWEWKVSL